MQKSYAQDIVRTHDYNRYLVSLHAKSYVQKKALWALFAFNYEVARTREIVSDTTIGLIRLTWWRDALKAIYSIPTEHKRSLDDHPILSELAEAIKQFNLPYELFDKILLGREFDLEDTQPESTEGLISYIQNTNLPLITAIAIISANKANMNNTHTENTESQQSLAIANGLSGIMRAIPFHAQHGIVMLPSRHISKNDVLSAKAAKIRPSLLELTAAANEALYKSIKSSKGPMRALHNLTTLELRHIEKCAYAVDNKNFQQKIPLLALRMRL